jgi:hypothetical protein
MAHHPSRNVTPPGFTSPGPFVAGRYDFHMGRKLQNHLEQSGFRVSKVLTLQDHELSFGGRPARKVVDAWRTRFKPHEATS